jgi:hypothetical protein
MALILTGASGSTTLDSSAGLTFSDSSNQAAAASPYGLKNRIINGDMRIDQRNAGASVTPANQAYAIDRWKNELTQASKFSVQQSTTAPTGFKNSMLITSLSAYSVISTDQFNIGQYIEGFNVDDLEWGTANAKTITLSFWVRSSLTGTFGGALNNAAGTRSYPFSYTISSANTWEQKSVTITGDTTGTWVTNNGAGVRVCFSLGSGSTLSGTTGVWAGAFYIQPTGSTSVVGTNGATFYITGVQLERNTTATPFEWIPYGTELALCQRYYYKWINNAGSSRFNITMQAYNTTSAFGKLFDLPVTMRSQPTATASGTFTGISAGGNLTTAFSGKTIDTPTAQTIATGGWTGSSGLVAGNCTILDVANNAYIEVSAEL